MTSGIGQSSLCPSMTKPKLIVKLFVAFSHRGNTASGGNGHKFNVRFKVLVGLFAILWQVVDVVNRKFSHYCGGLASHYRLDDPWTLLHYRNNLEHMILVFIVADDPSIKSSFPRSHVVHWWNCGWIKWGKIFAPKKGEEHVRNFRVKDQNAPQGSTKLMINVGNSWAFPPIMPDMLPILPGQELIRNKSMPQTGNRYGLEGILMWLTR